MTSYDVRNSCRPLATAVASGEYHCVTFEALGISQMLLSSTREDFRIIGRYLQHKKINYDDLFEFLYHEKSKQNLAFLVNMELVEMYKVGAKIVSEDHFFEKNGCNDDTKRFLLQKINRDIYT